MVLRRGLAFHVVLANVLAMGTATSVNYYLNRIWSFNSKAKVGRSLTLYLSLILFNMFFTSFMINLLVSWGMMDFWAKFLMMGLATLWNYIIYRQVIFK